MEPYNNNQNDTSFSPINWDSENNQNNNINNQNNQNNQNVPLQKLTDTQEILRSQPILVNIYNCVNYK